MKISKYHIILAIIILLGLGLRLYHVDYPYLDHHSWRQTDTASIAENFYKHGFNIFTPEIDWNGNAPSVIEVELQITPILTAFLYIFFGVKDWVGRIIPIIFSLLSIFYIYKLAAHYTNKKLALFCAFILAILPLNVFFSRVLMPESATMFFSIAALYYFTVYIDDESNKMLVIATAFASLAFLSKLPMVFLVLPLAIIALKKYGWRTILNKKVWIFFAVSILLTGTYYYYIHQASDIKNISYTSSDTGKWGNIQTWSDTVFYQTLLSRFETVIFTIPGLILLILGVILALMNYRKQYMIFGWIAAVIAYLFIMAPANEIHSYYQLPLIPIASIFIGIALYTIYEFGNLYNHTYLISRFGRHRRYIVVASKAFALVICALMLYLSIINALPMYGLYAKPSYDAGLKLESIDNTGLIISVPYRMDIMPEVFYYSGHKGWVVRPQDLTISSIEYYRTQGAKYIIFTDPYYMDASIQDYISKTQTYAGEGYIIAKI